MIDEDGDGVVAGFAVGGGAVGWGILAGDAAFGGEDESFRREEFSEDGDGGVEVAAGVVAEVEDEGLHAFGFEVVEGVFEGWDGVGFEFGEADVSDFGGVVEEERVFYGDGVGDLAGDVEREDFAGGGAAEAEADDGAGGAIEEADGFGGAEVGGGAVVDGEEDVSGEDASGGGGAVFTDGEGGELAALKGDGEAYGVVGADGISAALEVGDGFGVKELAVRIEASKHAFEGGIDEFLVGDVVAVDVVLPDELDGAGEAFDLGVAVVGGILGDGE